MGTRSNTYTGVSGGLNDSCERLFVSHILILCLRLLVRGSLRLYLRLERHLELRPVTLVPVMATQISIQLFNGHAGYFAFRHVLFEGFLCSGTRPGHQRRLEIAIEPRHHRLRLAVLNSLVVSLLAPEDLLVPRGLEMTLAIGTTRSKGRGIVYRAVGRYQDIFPGLEDGFAQLVDVDELCIAERVIGHGGATAFAKLFA